MYIELISKRILHYAPLGSEIIQELFFPSFNAMYEWVADKLENTKKDRVYLFTYSEIDGNEDTQIIVTDELAFLADFLAKGNYFGMDLIIVFFLQEYESFEDAYKVALDMKEVSPLCYNKS